MASPAMNFSSLVVMSVELASIFFRRDREAYFLIVNYRERSAAIGILLAEITTLLRMVEDTNGLYWVVG